MTELLTSDQMRALEQAAMESGEATGLDLMERAGQGVLDAILTKWPTLAKDPHRALVLCGPGNNGGDGFVIARLLADMGWEVAVALFGTPAKLPPDARKNHDRWRGVGEVMPWEPEAILATERPDVIIDAVFGIGLTRALPKEVAMVLCQAAPPQWERMHQISRVAVDCPSGLNADTGAFLCDPPVDGEQASRTTPNLADLTVTFHTPKPGHYLREGPDLCRDLVVVDIGLRGDAMERNIIGLPPGPERARLTEARHFGAAGLRPLPARVWPLSCVTKTRGGGHKYDFGNVFVFAGGVGRGGAGRLAARSALRAGAGLVTLICPPAALQENAARLDAVMLKALADGTPLDAVVDDRANGFCLGPGMGVGERTREWVSQALARRAGGRGGRDPVVVLDADALTSFADNPAELFSQLHERVILTPHDGEFARLFPKEADARTQGRSKIDVVRMAAQRAGCTVLLKGADTVIATPQGDAIVHAAAYDRAAPWLATAGAGDVLAGMILGLAAAPAAPDLVAAAEAAVWLHVETALSFGPGLIAEDLPDHLPRVLARLSGHAPVGQSS